MLGTFRQFNPITVSVPCGESSEILITENSSKVVRVSGSVWAKFDGFNLEMQFGLRHYHLVIPPNGTPVQFSFDDNQMFRGGVILTAIQNVTTDHPMTRK